MKKNTILENVFIEKLIFGWQGLATAEDGRKIIITGWAIPKSTVTLRILKVHKNRLEAQIVAVTKKSPYERELPSHWQIYGGCKWLAIPYEIQAEIKENQVKEAFYALKEKTEWTTFHPIVPSPLTEGYRNKVEFSWWKYISAKEDIHDEFRFWFHAPGQFDRIIDCSYCILADEKMNAIFKNVDEYSRLSGLATYDPKTGEGFWRHLVIRKSRKNEETMVIFSVNTNFPWWTRKEEWDFRVYANTLQKKFPEIVSIYLLCNTGRADIVTGEAILIDGKTTITEELLGKSFEINPKSFFQTNSLGAEKLYETTIQLVTKEEKGENKDTILLDLYGWTGTIGILLSSYFKKVYSVEIVKEASEDGNRNAKRNGIDNIEFVNMKTEDWLPLFLESRNNTPVTLVVDPPRDGMHPKAVKDILSFDSDTIIYVSCNPATLVRDLTILLENDAYKVSDIIPVDMFPHTHHIETVVRLIKIKKN